MDQLIVSNVTRIQDLAREHHVNRVRLFGSMSRDSAEPGSDVDLIADLEEGGTL